MSKHIMENLTIRPLNDILEKLSKRANEHEIRNGTLSALTERCNRLEAENANLRELVAEMYEAVKCCCDECWFGYSRNPAKCENENCGYRKEYVAMRELGVRLDG